MSVKVNACQSTEKIIELFRDVGKKPIAKFVYNADSRYFTHIVCLEMGRAPVHAQIYNDEPSAVHIHSMLRKLYILVSEISESGGLHNSYNITIFNNLRSPLANHMEIYVGPSSEDYQHYKEAFAKCEQLEDADAFSLVIQYAVKQYCERLMRLSSRDIESEHKIECEKAIDFLTEKKSVDSSIDNEKATVLNDGVVIPLPCTELDLSCAEFDFLKATKMDEEKITGNDRENILSCLKPILDVLEVDNDDICLYRDTPYYGFQLLTKYFSINARTGPDFDKGKYLFVLCLGFVAISNTQKNLNLVYEEGGKPNKEDEFFKKLKKVVGMFVEKEEENLKEFAGFLK